MDEQLHQLLNTLIPRPLYFLLAQFSNFIYRTFLGLYNDPTSWKSTLLPPLIALVTGYLALLTAFRTLRSTIALIWFSIKWGAIVGIVLAVYSWWVGESGAIHSAGHPGAAAGGGGFGGGILGAVVDGAARDLPIGATAAALTGLGSWLPFLLTGAEHHEAGGGGRARTPYGTRRSSRRSNSLARRGSTGAGKRAERQVAQRASAVAREWGLDVDEEEWRRGIGFMSGLLDRIGLGALVQGAVAPGIEEAPAPATRQAQYRNTRGAANPAGGGWLAPAEADDDDEEAGGPASRTRSRAAAAAASAATRNRQEAAAQARRARVDAAAAAAASAARTRAARRRHRNASPDSDDDEEYDEGGAAPGTWAGRGGRGGAADLQHTRREISELLQGLVRNFVG